MIFENCSEEVNHSFLFGRYEAIQVKSSEVKPIHLLCGLMREDKEMFWRLTSQAKVDLLGYTIKRMLAPNKGPFPIEIYFSEACVNIFEKSKKIAEKTGQKIVYTDHVLLAFLEYDKSGLSQILVDAGVTIEKVKKGLERFSPEYIARKATMDQLQKNTEELLGYLRNRNLDSSDWQKSFKKYLKEVHLLTSEVFH